jgi:hypothetical protein
MRPLRGLCASLASVAGALAVAVPASAAPQFGATLTLDPASGKGGTTVTATFQIEGLLDHCRLRVTYRWDDQDIGQDKSDNCTSNIRFKAPKDARDLGPHTVTAIDASTHLRASATFTVTAADGDPSPTRTRGQPSASGGQAGAVDPPPPGPTAEPSLPVVVPNAVPQVKSSSSALSGWVLAFGGALLGGGVVIFALMVMRLRRSEPDGERDPLMGIEPRHAAPLVDYPTQPIRVGSPATTPTREFHEPPETFV